MRVFPKYSPYHALTQHKCDEVVIPSESLLSPLDQEDAQSMLYIDEVTGFPCDSIHELVTTGECPSCLKSQHGSYPPKGLSVDELIALGTPSGIDSLVEKERYLDYLNSQIELVSNDSAESAAEPVEPVPESAAEPAAEPSK